MTTKVTYALLTALVVAALPAAAQDQTRMQSQSMAQEQLRDQDIYGYQLMTPAERDAYRAQMQNATTAEERERIRAQHHEQMVERAHQRGMSMPGEPPPTRSGMEPRGGMGPDSRTGPGGATGADGGRGGPRGPRY